MRAFALCYLPAIGSSGGAYYRRDDDRTVSGSSSTWGSVRNYVALCPPASDTIPGACVAFRSAHFLYSGATHTYRYWGHSHCLILTNLGTPPPPCPTNTVSNEHFLFGPYFFWDLINTILN